MPTIHLHLAVVLQPLGDGNFLDEVLLFPEICSFGDDPARLHRAVKNLLTRMIVNIAPAELHRRRLPGDAEASFVEVTLDPPKRSILWQEPLALRLPVVRWSHPSPAPAIPLPKGEERKAEAFLAFVPGLGIEVLAARADQLDEMLASHIRTALMRIKAAGSLERLVWLDRCRAVEIVRLECAVEVKSPKQLARETEDRRDQPEPVLGQVGVDLARETLRPAYELDAVIERLVETLTGPEPRSVLLVGPAGVGKTAAVHEMVRRRAELGLSATPFWATSGARLVAGMSGFGMWQERAAKLWHEASRARAVLHVGNLLELMEVGKSEHQAQGIASFLRPYLGRGDLLTIAECTPEQLPLIERQEPHLLSVFLQIPVAEPDRKTGVVILTKFAHAFRRFLPSPGTPGEGSGVRAVHSAASSGIPGEGSGLAKLDLLHRRYATYSAYPGRPLRFLQNLLTDLPSTSLSAGDVTHAFARETGLPMCLLDDAAQLDLAQTRGWFAQRVIGQAEPVDLVVDLLATVKAGLTRPRKPIASLLFIGPTGVGKTEMAKALAEFLFGSKERLTRFDMSEYADPQAVNRLIGGSTLGEGHLTARIREQPFSVLLLDEIEKAHPRLFDLLLQVLGEGRLTDAAGRVADFCNCVVIMTSNLGAESFQQAGLGIVQSTITAARSRDHFLHAVQDFFRPELFNRIDRVVPFAPLDEATILGIAHRQLELIQQRDGIRFRGVAVDLAPDVAAWLARRGFDARYGARPLKRAIDRELLAPLADKLNGYLADTPVRARLTVNAESLDAHVKAISADDLQSTRADADTVTACLDLRRDLQKLFQRPAVLEMDNEIHRLQLIEERTRRGKQVSPDDARRLGELAAWRAIRAGFDQLFTQSCSLEDRGLLSLLGEEPVDSAALQASLDSARADWNRCLLALYLRRFDEPDDVTVAIFSEYPGLLLILGEAYARIAEADGGKLHVWQFLARTDGRAKSALLPLRFVVDPKLLWRGAANIPMQPFDRDKIMFKPQERIARPFEGVIGLALRIHASAALPRFSGEAGLHRIRTAPSDGNCLVDTSALGVPAYQPPADMDRRGTIGSQDRRRTYDLVNGILEDARLPGKLYANADTLPTVLATALDRCLAKALEDLLKE